MRVPVALYPCLAYDVVNFDLSNRFVSASLVAQTVKNPPAVREIRIQSLVGKIPWKRAWQPTPVFLPGESPWTKEPGRLQSMWSQRVRHDSERLSTAH